MIDAPPRHLEANMAGRKKAISQYQEPLTPQEVAAGMNAARRNAARLLEDAKRLFEAKSYASAASIAILSIEESGKLSLLRGIATADGEKELKAEWRAYRDHQSKNVGWIFAELVANGARRLTDFSPVQDPNSDHPAVIGTVNQLGFYTDCYGDRHWSEPIEVIDERLAKTMLAVAEIKCPTHETSTREIELWVKHIHRGVSKAEGLQDLVNWHADVEREGLAHYSTEEMRSFVLGEGVDFLDGANESVPKKQ